MPKIKLGFYAVWSVVDGQAQSGRPSDNTVSWLVFVAFWKQAGLVHLHLYWLWNHFVCLQESEASVKWHCQEIGEGIEGSTIEASTQQKTGFVTLLLNMQINHNILSFEDLNSFIPVWSTSCGIAGVQPVPKTYRNEMFKCKMKCSNFKSTKKML